jgi:DNA replication protein DnaC
LRLRSCGRRSRSWIADRESIILIGDSGTAKTHLATALAVCACQQGRRVRFSTLAGLANELQEAEGKRELSRVVGKYARTELLVLDELGYLALPGGAAELVFQVLSERNERASLIEHLGLGEAGKLLDREQLVTDPAAERLDRDNGQDLRKVTISGWPISSCAEGSWVMIWSAPSTCP